MSSYYDPRWYEQPEQQNNPNSHQPAHDQFNTFPASDSNAFTQKGVSEPERHPESNDRRRRVFVQFAVMAGVVIVAFLAGWFSHQTYTTSFFNQSDKSRSYENLFDQAWTIVDQNYVDRKAVNYQQMSYSAIQAMLNVLHDTGHTRFLTPAEIQAENQQLSGNFTGIGIYLAQDPKTKQIYLPAAPIPGSPAEQAGFKRSDIILAINGVGTTGKDIPTVQALIHSTKPGTSVAITVLRPSTHQTITFHVIPREFQVQNVIMYYIAHDHIADIQIIGFDNGVSDQLRTDLLQAKKLGATRIILDLRDNPGGYTQEAIDTASEFMARGNVFLEQDSSGNRTPEPVTGNPIDTTSPMVVLVNGNTGSSAEIVSGALQDNHRAEIIGTKTFGTGTVLQQFTLADGSALLIGVGEWLTPDGHFIRDQGITPNIVVPLSANANPLTPSDENADNMSEQQILNSGDAQLVAAIHYLDTHK